MLTKEQRSIVRRSRNLKQEFARYDGVTLYCLANYSDDPLVRHEALHVLFGHNHKEVR